MEIFITGGTGNIGQYVTLSTAFLLEAAEKKGVKKFIYTSSTAALGNLRNGMGDMREHIKWNIERALASKEGRKIHDVVHEFDK